MVVPPSPFQLSEQQTEFVEKVRHDFPNNDNGIETYHEIRQYLRNELQ